MQLLTAFLLLVSASLVNADNCSVQEINDALQPFTSDSNFATCQSDSNYTLLSSEPSSLNQTRSFCSSPACQELLNTTLASNLLPDCEVVTGSSSLHLSDAVAAVVAKCGGTAPVQLNLQERAVDKRDVHSKAQRASGHVATILGHSAPMDEVGEVAGALLSLLRG